MNRSDLRFNEVVEKIFSFLNKYGFTLLTSDRTFVRYESEETFVSVHHGRISYEINAIIGRLYNSDNISWSEGEAKRAVIEDGFSIWEIALFEGAPHVNEKTFFQASTKEIVKSLVPNLAEIVHTYGSKALRGDEAYYDQLRAFRESRSNQYLHGSSLARARQKADMAWRRKDYSAVVTEFQPFLDDLSPAELKKYQYAIRHAQKN